MDATVSAILEATLRIATPLLLAAVGELITEKAGILDLGIEGTVLLGAFVGFWAAYLTGNPWIGVMVGMVAGACGGIIVGWLTITMTLNQHVAGLGVTMLLSGLTYFLFRAFFGDFSAAPQLPQKIMALGSGGSLTFLSQSPLTYAAIALVPLVGFVLHDTKLGLQLRAVGESPKVAESVGIKVKRIRYSAIVTAGVLMGLAGSFLTVAELGSFSYGIVAGRGWVAVALVIFGGWSAPRIGIGAFLFAFIEAVELHLQATGNLLLPSEFYLLSPYALTIMAMVVAGTNHRAPAALCIPYRKEE